MLATKDNNLGAIAAGCAAVLGVFFLGIPFAFLLSFAFVALDTWVCSYLYEWFILKPFNSPLLTFWQIFGIVLTIHFLRYQYAVDKPKETSTNWSGLVGRILSPLITLGFGYLVYTYLL